MCQKFVPPASVQNTNAPLKPAEITRLLGTVAYLCDRYLYGSDRAFEIAYIVGTLQARGVPASEWVRQAHATARALGLPYSGAYDSVLADALAEM